MVQTCRNGGRGSIVQEKGRGKSLGVYAVIARVSTGQTSPRHCSAGSQDTDLTHCWVQILTAMHSTHAPRESNGACLCLTVSSKKLGDAVGNLTPLRAVLRITEVTTRAVLRAILAHSGSAVARSTHRT